MYRWSAISKLDIRSKFLSGQQVQVFIYVWLSVFHGDFDGKLSSFIDMRNSWSEIMKVVQIGWWRQVPWYLSYEQTGYEGRDSEHEDQCHHEGTPKQTPALDYLLGMSSKIYPPLSLKRQFFGSINAMVGGGKILKNLLVMETKIWAFMSPLRGCWNKNLCLSTNPLREWWVGGKFLKIN